MKFEVLVFNEGVVATKFERMGANLVDARPGFEEVGDYLRNVADKTFSSQGRRGGGRWKMLTREWFERKERAGFDPRIMFMRGDLHSSLTKKTDSNHILDINRSSIILGTELPYATRHHFGYRQTPRRPLFKITKRDQSNIRNILRDHIMKSWRAANARV